MSCGGDPFRHLSRDKLVADSTSFPERFRAHHLKDQAERQPDLRHVVLRARRMDLAQQFCRAQSIMSRLQIEESKLQLPLRRERSHALLFFEEPHPPALLG